MTPSITAENLSQWARACRGRSLEFFATDEEIQEWLNTYLPPDLAPYKLLGSRSVRLGRRHYIWQAVQCEAANYSTLMRDLLEVPANLWIWSRKLRPDLPIISGDTGNLLDTVCSLSGLIVLQPGLPFANGPGASSIGMVDRVANVETEELVEHTDYLKVFERLRRAIKKKLVYSSIRTFHDGTEFEETQRERMTEGAVQAYRAGFRFSNRPGRYLGKKP